MIAHETDKLLGELRSSVAGVLPTLVIGLVVIAAFEAVLLTSLRAEGWKTNVLSAAEAARRNIQSAPRKPSTRARATRRKSLSAPIPIPRRNALRMAVRFSTGSVSKREAEQTRERDQLRMSKQEGRTPRAVAQPGVGKSVKPGNKKVQQVPQKTVKQPHAAAGNKKPPHQLVANIGNQDYDLVKHYCRNVGSTAEKVRQRRKQLVLKKMAAGLENKIAELKKLIREHKALLNYGARASKAASKKLVGIYENMATDSAASQIARMDPTTATSLLRKLEPRRAAEIMGEMSPKDGARLTRMMAARLQLVSRVFGGRQAKKEP